MELFIPTNMSSTNGQILSFDCERFVNMNCKITMSTLRRNLKYEKYSNLNFHFCIAETFTVDYCFICASHICIAKHM